MATSAYYAWAAAGRHWQLAQPISEIVAVAKRHGIAILGTLGNDDHLMADFPEDHTPFSRTYWPVQAPGWVCACDLANAQGLGDAILRDARAGRLPWLKYMNFAGKTYSHEGGFQAGYDNADEHVHLSCRSDWTTRGIGTYDPLGNPQEDDVTLDEMYSIIAGVANGSTAAGYIEATAPPAYRAIGKYNIRALDGKLDLLLKQLGVAQADIDELQARPSGFTAEQVKELAASLAAEADASVVEQALVDVLGRVGFTVRPA